MSSRHECHRVCSSSTTELEGQVLVTHEEHPAHTTAPTKMGMGWQWERQQERCPRQSLQQARKTQVSYLMSWCLYRTLNEALQTLNTRVRGCENRAQKQCLVLCVLCTAHSSSALENRKRTGSCNIVGRLRRNCGRFDSFECRLMKLSGRFQFFLVRSRSADLRRGIPSILPIPHTT